MARQWGTGTFLIIEIACAKLKKVVVPNIQKAYVFLTQFDLVLRDIIK